MRFLDLSCPLVPLAIKKDYPNCEISDQAIPKLRLEIVVLMGAACVTLAFFTRPPISLLVFPYYVGSVWAISGLTLREVLRDTVPMIIMLVTPLILWWIITGNWFWGV